MTLFDNYKAPLALLYSLILDIVPMDIKIPLPGLRRFLESNHPSESCIVVKLYFCPVYVQHYRTELWALGQ